jgi:hypothetical protein
MNRISTTWNGTQPFVIWQMSLSIKQVNKLPFRFVCHDDYLVLSKIRHSAAI